jgi:hypothetical protein
MHDKSAEAWGKKNYIFYLQQSIIVRDKCKNETHVHVQKQENETAVSLIISYVRDTLYCLWLEMPDYKHEVSADHNM